MQRQIFNLLIVLFLTSCGKDIHTYHIQISNNYFEPIKNIQIDTIMFGDLGTNEISETKILQEGNYQFSAVTSSNLQLTTDIFLTGKDTEIELSINNKGNLTRQ